MTSAERRDREHAVRQARTTLIDALRLVDQGNLNEAALGCILALVFLRQHTDGERIYELAQPLLRD